MAISGKAGYYIARTTEIKNCSCFNAKFKKIKDPMNVKNIIPKVQVVKPMNDYRLYLEFDDGVKGEVDLSAWIGKGVFSLWNDENNFKKIHITSSKKIEWSEDIDMDPDAFYLQLVNKTFEEYAGS
jgi:hypothetical protein